MLRVVRRVLPSIAFALAVSCGGHHDASTPPRSTATGFWHVEGGFIRDPEGRSVIMRGVNASGAAKFKPYLGYEQPDDFARISGRWGFTGIRFLVVWAAIEPTEGNYDEAYLDEIAKRVQWAQDAGLLVVVDMHEDLYGEGFPGGDGAPRWTCDESYYAAYKPRTPWALGYTDVNLIACADHFWHTDSLQDHYVKAWTKVAQKLAPFSAVVGFDPMNEPFWGSAHAEFEPSILTPLYAKITSAVRAVAPHWLAFVEPSGLRNLGIPTHLPPMPFADVVYAPHSYDSGAESGAGFNPNAHDVMMSNVVALKDDANAIGAAIWIGEYGGYGAGLQSYMDAEYNGAGQIASGQMYWSDDRGGDYSTLDADGSERATLLDVIVRPFPSRVAGDPISYAFDEPTSTFAFRYRPNTSLTAPTEISVPPRRFPSGYSAHCDGCTIESRGPRAIVTSTSGAEVTVTIGPP